MAIDEYTRLREALGDAERRLANDEPSNAPPVLPAPPNPIRKDLDVARLKSMTEDELLDELKNAANAADAQMIMAELLKPTWTLVAGYWAVIIGLVIMMIVALIFQFHG